MSLVIQNLKNVISARDFTWWINGHNDMYEFSGKTENSRTKLNIDFGHKPLKSAVVIGLGNVALDVARILLGAESFQTQGADSPLMHISKEVDQFISFHFIILQNWNSISKSNLA